MLQLLTIRNRRHSNVDISDGIMFISSRALLSGLLKWLAFHSIIKNEWLCLSSGVIESAMICKINWRQGERGRLQLPHKSVARLQHVTQPIPRFGGSTGSTSETSQKLTVLLLSTPTIYLHIDNGTRAVLGID